MHVALGALQALRSLGERAAPHADQVAPLLHHYSVDVRCLAALLLGELGAAAEGNAAHVRELLREPSAHARRAGLVGLGRLRCAAPASALSAGRETAHGGSSAVLAALGLDGVSDERDRDFQDVWGQPTRGDVGAPRGGRKRGPAVRHRRDAFPAAPAAIPFGRRPGVCPTRHAII